MFDIAIILVHYNSGTLTAECINSIISKTAESINYQIIVVDNNSEYADYLQLKQSLEGINFKNLKLIRSRINTGFGGGNMAGVLQADARYFAFVNNDTVFKTDCLSALLQGLKTIPGAGIAGGQSFKEDGSFLTSFDHFSSPAREILGRGILEKTNPKRFPKRKKLYDSPVRVDFVAGSFMMIRASDFYAVGGFDNNIFLYHEETDLCKRLKAIGKSAWLIPQAQFLHYHGASTGRSVAIKKELKISLLYIIRKHYGISGRFTVWFYLLVKYAISSLVKPKNWPQLALIVKGAPLSASLKQKQVIAEK